MISRPPIWRQAVCLLVLSGFSIAEAVGGQPNPSEQKPMGGAGNEYVGVEVEVMKVGDDGPSRVLPVEISVESDQVIGPFHKTLFGLNFDRHGLETALVEQTGGIDPDGARLLSGIPMTMSRVAGSDAMRFRWKSAIGPMEQRTPQQLWPWASLRPISIGPVEFESWLRGIDPNSATAWVLNLFQDSPEDHADLVEFLTGKPGRSRGGVDWAKRRVELGLEKPVNVQIWELGNEVDWDAENKWTIDQYIAECRKTIAAIRSVDPGAKIAAHALTAPWSPDHKEFGGGNWAGWHRALLKELGKDIDFISFHPYYNGEPTSAIETYLDRIRDDIQAITGENRIRIYVSEHARWPAMPASGRWEENWHQTHSLDGCLATAQFLVRCMTRPEIVAASYHSAVNAGPWGLLYRDSVTQKLFSTGMAEVMRLFAKIPQGDVVRTAVTGEKTSVSQPDLDFVASAVRSGDKLYLVVVNRGGLRESRIVLPGDFVIKRSWVLSAENGEVVNTANLSPLQIKDHASSEKGPRPLKKMISPLSLTLLEFAHVP